jgi:hypothetical protein
MPPLSGRRITLESHTYAKGRKALTTPRPPCEPPASGGLRIRSQTISGQTIRVNRLLAFRTKESTMEDFTNYIKLRTRYDGIESELEDISGTLSGLSYNLLNNRQKLVFTNLGTALRPEALLQRDSIQISPNDLPSAQRINDLLQGWYQARIQMAELWSRISEDVKGGLVPPPSDCLPKMPNRRER